MKVRRRSSSTGPLVLFPVLILLPAWSPAARGFAPTPAAGEGDLRAAPPFGISAENIDPASGARMQSVLEGFCRATGSRWRAASWAPVSLTPALAVGSGLDLHSPIPDRDGAVRAARDFVDAHPDLFRSGGARLAEPRVRFGLGKWSVHWQEQVGGMPILHSRVTVLLTRAGRLAAFCASTYPTITRAEAPVLAPADARRIARAHLVQNGLLPPSASLTREAVRGPYVLPVIEEPPGARDDGEVTAGKAADLPARVTGRTILRVSLASLDPPAAYDVDVDAVTGSVLQRTDVLRRDFGGSVSGTVEFPSWCDGFTDEPTPELVVTVSHAGADTTGPDGTFLIPSQGADPETLSAVLSGPFVQVENVLGSGASLRSVIEPGVFLPVSWDSTNSGPEERDAFAFTNDIHRMIKATDPSWTDLDHPLLARVNIMQACNAYWDGESINFFHEGGGCANSARIAGVVAHEYTHGVTDFMYGEDDPPLDVHEGNSDVGGNSLTNSPVFAGFYLDNCVDGVRNSDNDLRWPEDAEGDGHHDGQILAGFHWHARDALINELGYEQGAVAAVSIWHFARLLGLPQSQQEQVWWSFLADDDNGNLDDGTPHRAALAAAAARHGFECPEAFDDVVIRHVPLVCASSPDGEPIPVEAVLYSLAGPLDPDSLLAFYRPEGDEGFTTALFRPTGDPDQFRAVLPGGWRIGSRTDYWIQATDLQGHRLRRPETGLYSFVVAFACDDFELDGSWTVGASGDNCPPLGRWVRCDPPAVVEPPGVIVQPEVDTTPDPGHLCWITGEGEDADGRTTLVSPIFNLVGMRWATVRYNRWFQTTHDALGAIEFRVNYDGGLTWYTLDRVSGCQDPAAWTPREIQLQPPGGQFGMTQFRVVLLGNYMNSTDEGGFDDFMLLADDQDPSAVPAPVGGSPAHLDLRLLGPNPSAGVAVLEYALSENGSVHLGVYKLDGSLVRELVEGEMPAGVHQAIWNGTDASGRRVPSGIYFARLTSSSGSSVRRLLIAR